MYKQKELFKINFNLDMEIKYHYDLLDKKIRTI